MKKSKEVLDDFGKKIIERCFDPAIGNCKSLKAKENPPAIFKNYTDLFKKLDNKEFDVLIEYLKESYGNILFNFLGIFEESNNYKILFEEDGSQVDLNKISEMLKAEPIIENGWIQRFSKEI